jgi:ATP-dependent DNA ligase
MIEPMKADSSLKPLIRWGTADLFRDIAGEFFNDQWVMEPKIDGCRALLEMKADRSRFGGMRASSFPQFGSIAIADLAGTVLDGEFVAPALPGRDKALLKHSTALFNSGPAAAMKWRMYGPARFVIFDVLAIAGKDVTGYSYDQRRILLGQVYEMIMLEYPDCGIEIIEQGPATAEYANKILVAGGEGVMLKLRAGAYEHGKRSLSWRKVKRFDTVDCFLTGEARPHERNPEIDGSVQVAVAGAGGQPVIVGHVKVEEAFRAYMRKGVVIEVMTQGITEAGVLRHPHMLALRPDKKPADCDETQLLFLAKV